MGLQGRTLWPSDYESFVSRQTTNLAVPMAGLEPARSKGAPGPKPGASSIPPHRLCASADADLDVCQRQPALPLSGKRLNQHSRYTSELLAVPASHEHPELGALLGDLRSDTARASFRILFEHHNISALKFKLQLFLFLLGVKVCI